MELYRIIKADSRAALRRYWGKSSVAAFVLMGAYLTVSLAEAVLMFVFSGSAEPEVSAFSLSKTPLSVLVILGGAYAALLVLMPALAVGYKGLHLDFASGGDAFVAYVFEMFSTAKRFFSCIWLYILLAFRLVWCTAVAILPGGALVFAATVLLSPASRQEYILQVCALCTGGILLILCLLLEFIFAQRWFLAPYYLAVGKSPAKAIALSVRGTKGFCTTLFRFKFSFFGWGLLTIFVLPVLWSLPYYSTACGIFAKYLIEKSTPDDN